ncbi:Fe-only nitrogenase accessory protein AnfO [Brenneria izadpanahii]|uniref:Fe-only nitrogenase accessory protein AnfO n=1 Tax=Brenneria izadpanahii TaxID=2722756 RepID=A0ABX7UNL3_9GAMM|nr:Fe-only nitrogenase accessory protein AnfO [Brenneria izadpanahii]QTF07221.1 Fe-only nitrogenase accessory protein AnfO [Brenneria izadpanahii]
MKIAVFINQNGNIAPLFEPGKVKLFSRCDDRWQAAGEIPFTLNYDMSLSEIRTRTLTLLEEMPGCHHFVARQIQGALLAWFDGMGVTMWQFTGIPEDCLAVIYSSVKQVQRATAVPAAAETFIQAGERDGEYHIDLIAALAGDARLTSKQLLIPFLQSHTFTRLNVTCDHLPKWFEQKLPALNLAVDVEKQRQGRLCAVIHPNAVK